MDKVLVIEDDKSIQDLILYTLEGGGFNVSTSSNIKEAIEIISSNNISLTLLDLNLPDGDGLSLIRELNQRGIPVIILTARSTVVDKVKGLNSGADDYIVKPFDTLELLARVKAILRRMTPALEILTLGENRVNFRERKLLRGDRDITLTMKEWELLEFLNRNRGQVLSRETLLNRVWGQDFYGSTRTVDVHVQKLRSKIGDKHITTLYKQGYRLES